jgi:hypothetical protein
MTGLEMVTVSVALLMPGRQKATPVAKTALLIFKRDKYRTFDNPRTFDVKRIFVSPFFPACLKDYLEGDTPKTMKPRSREVARCKTSRAAARESREETTIRALQQKPRDEAPSAR